MPDLPDTRPITTSVLAIVSLVFGALAWVGLPFIGAVVAVVTGHLARSEIRRGAPDRRIEGDGLAIAGLVLGYVQLCLVALLLVVLFLVLVMGFGWHW